MLGFAITGTLLVILSAVSPIIVSYLTKASWSSKTKQSVALLVTLAIAVVVAFVPVLGGSAVLAFGGGVGPFVESLVAAGGVIFTIQQVVFTYIFKDTEFATVLLEDKGVTDTVPADTDVDGHGLEPTEDGEGIVEEEPTEEDVTEVVESDYVDPDAIDPTELKGTEGN